MNRDECLRQINIWEKAIGKLQSELQTAKNSARTQLYRKIGYAQINLAEWRSRLELIEWAFEPSMAD
jgi:hypothetical protein